MAEETKQPQRIGRLQIGVNVIVQVALAIILAAMVNYLGFEHYKRWDYSREHKYELSDKTKRAIGTIKDKMRVIVSFAPNTPITSDVESLITEYQYAAKKKIDVEHIDPQRNLARAKELYDKYKVVTDESVIILDYAGRNKIVKASEMADVDQSGAMMGEGPRVTAFKGEQAITSAMIDLVEGKKNVLGYLVGHREPSIASAPPALMLQQQQPEATSPLTVLKTAIENENITMQEVNLANVDAVPPEVKTLMICGAQYDLSDREMKIVRDFWAKQGRLLVLLDPSGKTPKLTAFLNELGVRVNDDRLMALMKTGIQEVARVRDVVARFLPDAAPTRQLGDVRAPFFGGTSSLTLENDRVRQAGLMLQPLAQAEKGYWGEVDYNSTDENQLKFDQGRDHAEPLTIAASVEKSGGDQRVEANASRLIVVANSTFVQDNAITQGQQALDFMSGAINWLLSREQMIGIAPKVSTPLTFSLDENALRNIRWLILVLLPLVPAILGTFVWWQRRA